MRNLLILAVCLAATCTAASAENTGGSPAKSLTDAERARLKSQVDELKNAKLQAGEKSAATANDAIKRQTGEIDQKQQQAKRYIDKKTGEWSWVVGPDAAKRAGAAQQAAVDEKVNAAKAQLVKDAQKKAASQQAAAKKSAESVMQTVEGLKSQVSKDGKYGLQPKGSSLYVRQYGK